MPRSRGKSSRQKYDLQKLINHVRDSNESWQIIRTWQNTPGDDRSQAIMVGALLEQALEFAIDTHFVITEEQSRSVFTDQADGGISSFSTKIKIAFALGVIEDLIRAELVRIKNIRNVFAHTRASVTFDTKEIADACDQLYVPQVTSYGGLMGMQPTTAKEKFASSIDLIYLYLGGRDFQKKKAPMKYSESEYYKIMFLKHAPGWVRVKPGPGLISDFLQETSQKK